MNPVAQDFDDHQRRTVQLMDSVIGGLEAGMSEADIADLAEARRDGYGFDRWFHAPKVRIAPTKRPRLLKRKLAVGEVVSIDLAPGTKRAFGDLGASVVFGAPETDLVRGARETCKATCGFASRWKCVGELFVFARAWANNRQLKLATDSTIGHACLPPEGAWGAGYPRAAHVGTLLPRYQIRMLNPQRIRGVWAIRPPVTDGSGTVLSFEELVYVDEEVRTVLGRDDLDAIGTYSSLG